MFSPRSLPLWIGLVLLTGVLLLRQEADWLGQRRAGPGDPVPPKADVAPYLSNAAEPPSSSPGQYIQEQADSRITNARFTADGKRTVKDNVTGLVWQRCSAGLRGSDCSKGTAATRTWAKASTYCRRLALGGYRDWRLPGIGELRSIVARDRCEPAVDPAAFPQTVSGWYWSSSTLAYDPRSAWIVSFVYGSTFYQEKTHRHHVRCVRGQMPISSFTDSGDDRVRDDATRPLRLQPG